MRFGRAWEPQALLTSIALISTCTVAAPVDFQNLCSAQSVTLNNNQPNIWPWLSYVTTNATPPWFQINQTGEALGSGYVFMTQDVGILPNRTVKEVAGFIMTDQGDLVWSGPEASVANLRVQTLNDEPVLIYWEGVGSAANAAGASNAFGHVVIIDQSYTQLYEICPQLDLLLPPGIVAPCAADEHEAYITKQNTLLVTSYNITTANLTTFGGPPQGYILDPLVIEVDIETSEVLWSWSPYEHIPLNQTKVPLRGLGLNTSLPFDWFHTNSIEQFEDYIVINARNTWTTYVVDRSGSVVYEINGATGGDFGPLPPGGNFSFQHDARLVRIDDTTVEYHNFANDNSAPFVTSIPSVALTLSLTWPPNPASPPVLLANYVDPVNPVVAFAEGSNQPLANGNDFVGYGIQPYMKEFGSTPPGTPADVRWSVQFAYPLSGQTYRAFKQEWAAILTTSPTLVVESATTSDSLTSCAAGSTLRGYVSWNGATNVDYYIVFAGADASSLAPVGKVSKLGFETEFVVPADAGVVQVGAVIAGVAGVAASSEVVTVA